MTTLSSAADNDLRLTGRDAAAPDDVSPDVARDLHADALRLKRAELKFVVPFAIAAVTAGIGAMVFPQPLWFVAISAAPLLFNAGQWAVEWTRLRRTDPLDFYRRERREERDDAEGSPTSGRARPPSSQSRR